MLPLQESGGGTVDRLPLLFWVDIDLDGGNAREHACPCLNHLC